MKMKIEQSLYKNRLRASNLPPVLQGWRISEPGESEATFKDWQVINIDENNKRAVKYATTFIDDWKAYLRKENPLVFGMMVLSYIKGKPEIERL